MPGDVALVFAANDRYARGLAVAIDSSLRHLSAAVSPEVYILDDGLSESSRSRISRIVERTAARDTVRWVTNPRHAFGSEGSTSPALSSSYLRLLIADILPQRITRAVYLDSDVLVRRDLSPLFDTPLNGAVLGAVRDYAIATTTHPWAGLETHTGSHPYLNAGVLVIDLARWRATSVGDRALRSSTEPGPGPSWDDQGMLNAVVETWHELNPTWNVQLLNLAVMERLPPTEISQHLVDERERLVRDGAVFHFVGPNPWSTRSMVIGTDEWVAALLHTGWYPPLQAILWLMVWLCGWIPQRCVWMGRRVIVRLMTAPSVGRARRLWLRRRSPAAS